jgi:dTDP-4-dehydrorhamnose 3,5-epimerase
LRVHQTDLADVLVFAPAPHHDARGWFSRTFDAATARAAGVDPDGFLQDSQSRSRRGVVRGLHGRVGHGEAKLVRCAHGALRDVVVDARPTSPTFGRWQAFTLDDDSLHSLYIPRGFLHGFQALTDTADICYRIDAEHDPVEDVAVRWDDPELAIDWPLEVSVMSDKDRNAGTWADLARHLRRAHDTSSLIGSRPT